AKDAWGKGFATEAAKVAMAFGFNQLALNEIVSFTATTNQRSMAVMERIGMQNTQQNFNHPAVSPDSPLYEHVLYKVTRQQWEARQ
ncbi:MAG: GNAT family N-acetyltransferase, partial [Nitrosomonas sp.]|nr:GNAT family N-acetyltransferase [Nitrosomonas sp.]